MVDERDRREAAHAGEQRLPWSAIESFAVAQKKLFGLEEIRQRYNLPLSNLRVLILLEQQGYATMTEISERFGIAKSNMTPLVDRLVAGGFVRRTNCQQDQRVVQVELIDTGRARLEEIHRFANERYQRFLCRLPERVRSDFHEALETFCELVQFDEADRAARAQR